MTRTERRRVWIAALKKDPVRWANYRAKRRSYDKTYRARYPEKIAAIQKRAQAKYNAKTAPAKSPPLVGQRIERVGNRTIHRLLDDEAVS